MNHGHLLLLIPSWYLCLLANTCFLLWFLFLFTLSCRRGLRCRTFVSTCRKELNWIRGLVVLDLLLYRLPFVLNLLNYAARWSIIVDEVFCYVANLRCFDSFGALELRFKQGFSLSSFAISIFFPPSWPFRIWQQDRPFDVVHVNFYRLLALIIILIFLIRWSRIFDSIFGTWGWGHFRKSGHTFGGNCMNNQLYIFIYLCFHIHL